MAVDEAKMSSEGADELVVVLQKIAKLKSEIPALEEEELSGSTSVGPRLMIRYLATNESRSALETAKRLGLKSTPVVGALGTVAAALVARDAGAAQLALSTTAWPEELKDEVTLLADCLRVQHLRVVAAAYDRIRVPVLAKALGLTPDAAVAAVAKLGWATEADLVSVQRLPAVEAAVTAAPFSLSTLTHYVSFLEN